MKKWLAILLVLGSAIIFGVTPALIRFTYDMGSNGTNATFMKSLLAIPILIGILLKLRIPIMPEKSNWKIVFLWMGLCMAITSVLLTISYAYIPVGISTVLHFIYPTMVAVLGVIIFKQRPNKGKIISLVLCLIGIAMFFEKGGSVNILGIIMALCSGVTYALYIIGLDHPSVQKMHYLRLTLYMNISIVIVSGIFGAARGEIVFDMPMLSWIYMLICAVFTMVLALCMFAVGAKYIGGLTSAVLSTLEPITSVITGWLFLGESLTWLKLIGCVFIIISIIVITRAQEPENNAESE